VRSGDLRGSAFGCVARCSRHSRRALASCRPAFGFYERVVDVIEELMKFTLLTRDVAPYLVDRYSERRESAEELSKRVNQRSI
jgi:hypothetical protein